MTKDGIVHAPRNIGEAVAGRGPNDRSCNLAVPAGMPQSSEESVDALTSKYNDANQSSGTMAIAQLSPKLPWV